MGYTTTTLSRRNTCHNSNQSAIWQHMVQKQKIEKKKRNLYVNGVIKTEKNPTFGMREGDKR